MLIYACKGCEAQCATVSGAATQCEDCGRGTTWHRVWDGQDDVGGLCMTCARVHSRMADPYKHEPSCDGPEA